MKILWVALFLFLVACSQSQTDVQNDVTNDVQNDAPSNEVQGSSDLDKLEKLFSAKTNTQWKISYNIVNNYDGQTMSSTMTQYMKTDKKMRTDVALDGMESRMYIVDDTYTSCTKYSADWSCMQFTDDGSTEELEMVEVEENIEERPDDYDVVEDGTKVVAGITAECYKIAEKNENSVIRYCFANDGAPLYVYVSSPEGTSEMTATSYAKSVSDSDFKLPAEPKSFEETMPAFPDGSPGEMEDFCAACNYLTGEEKDECLASC